MESAAASVSHGVSEWALVWVLVSDSQLPWQLAVGVGVTVAVAVAVGSGRCCRSRRGCRRSSRNTEGINFVVIGDIDAAASDDATVPFARAGHHVGAGVNHSAGVTIVAV